MIADFTRLFGMVARGSYVTHPALSATRGDHARNHAHTREPDISELERIAGVPATTVRKDQPSSCRRSSRGRS